MCREEQWVTAGADMLFCLPMSGDVALFLTQIFVAFEEGTFFCLECATQMYFFLFLVVFFIIKKNKLKSMAGSCHICSCD